MNNIIETAKNAKEIMRSPCLCPICNQTYFAGFDRLYVDAYGKCADCSTEDEVEENMGNIFLIIDAI